MKPQECYTNYTKRLQEGFLCQKLTVCERVLLLSTVLMLLFCLLDNVISVEMAGPEKIKMAKLRAEEELMAIRVPGANR